MNPHNVTELFSAVRFRFCSYRELEAIVKNPTVPQSMLVEALMARLKPHELEMDTKHEAAINEKSRPFLNSVIPMLPTSPLSSSTSTTVNPISTSSVAGPGANSSSAVEKEKEKEKEPSTTPPSKSPRRPKYVLP